MKTKLGSLTAARIRQIMETIKEKEKRIHEIVKETDLKPNEVYYSIEKMKSNNLLITNYTKDGTYYRLSQKGLEIPKSEIVVGPVRTTPIRSINIKRNTQIMLDKLKYHGPMNSAQLSGVSKISWGDTSRTLESMIENKLVEKQLVKQGNSNRIGTVIVPTNKGLNSLVGSFTSEEHVPTSKLTKSSAMLLIESWLPTMEIEINKIANEKAIQLIQQKFNVSIEDAKKFLMA